VGKPRGFWKSSGPGTIATATPRTSFRDELLDIIMLYWVTATAASSARLYWEGFGPKRRTPFKVTIPTGVAVFPKEIVAPVRKWMEASYTNIQHWSEMPKGGHFAAFEQPELFVQELRACFRQFR